MRIKDIEVGMPIMQMLELGEKYFKITPYKCKKIKR